MAFFPINMREFRSFRLLKQTKKLAKQLEIEDGSTMYVMCDSLHPHERIEMRQQFEHAHGLSLVFLPKNVSRNLLRGSEWSELRNLLDGHVVQIFNQSGDALTEKQLQFIVNYKKFSLRFLLWRRQIYRAQRLRQSFGSSNTANVSNVMLAAQVAQKVNSLTIMPFLTGHGNVLA